MDAPVGFRQIGWISEALCESSAHGDEDEAFESFVTSDFIDVQRIDDYAPGTLVHHSHGPVCAVIPVYIPWPSGQDTRPPEDRSSSGE